MKFNKKTPCSECPFRKTALPGWLGPDSAKSVMEKVHGEGGYPCHMDMDGKPKDASGNVDCTEVEQCAGAIFHANASCKSYRDPDLNKMQKRLGTDFQVLNRLEFVKHHDVPINMVMRKYLDSSKPRKKA